MHDGRFSRQYRAALLDYLLGSGELGRERAYELGRRAVDLEIGLLPLLSIHQRVVNGIAESSRTEAHRLDALKSSDEFLSETLSAFEMAYCGYVDLIDELRRAPHVLKPGGRENCRRRSRDGLGPARGRRRTR